MPLNVSFAGNTVQFSSDQPVILQAIQTHFGACGAESGPLIAHYHIAAITEKVFSISENGSVLHSRLNFEQVLWNLMQDALTRLNGSAISGAIFHAAALEKAKKGIILCGQSGCGKTSLAAWLLINGFNYLSDEVISSRDGKISGFPRSLVLKPGSAFIWQRWVENLTSEGFLRFSDDSAWVAPSLFGADVARQAQPRLLVFPRYAPGAGFRLQKLSQAEALFHLMECLVNARNLPAHGMDEASQLARRVRAFSLEYSDIEQATEWIGQTL